MQENSLLESERENKIDLIPLFYAAFKQIRRSWWVGLIIAVLCAGMGFFYARYTYSPKYEAKASFVVSMGDSSGISASRYYNSVTTDQLAATFPYILTSGALNKVVANDLDVPSVPGTITASALGETNLFQISVVASDGQTAYDVLQSVIDNYPSVAKYVIGNTSLKKLEDSGVPAFPMNSYNYRGYILRFVLVGFILYLAILVFLMRTNKTVSTRDELLKYVNAPYLGGIPSVRAKQRSKGKEKQSSFLSDDAEQLPGG